MPSDTKAKTAAELLRLADEMANVLDRFTDSMGANPPNCVYAYRQARAESPRTVENILLKRVLEMQIVDANGLWCPDEYREFVVELAEQRRSEG